MLEFDLGGIDSRRMPRSTYVVASMPSCDGKKSAGNASDARIDRKLALSDGESIACGVLRDGRVAIDVKRLTSMRG